MGFKKNVGLIDRIFRAAFGTGFVAYGLLYLVGVPSIVVVLVGAVLLVTAFRGSCFIYSLFGINTCRNPYCDVEREEEPMPEVEELMMAEKMPPVEIEKPKVKAKKPKKARRKRRRKKR